MDIQGDGPLARRATSGIVPRAGKCTRCKAPAVARFPSHNARFCADCFILFFKNAVSRAAKRV
ncbi:MAG: hypothetical protein JRI97_10310, partial [Deltaproteobacteria bacterium]|nr:hypothetical protein [Deltaproteobacteria bacterium]